MMHFYLLLSWAGQGDFRKFRAAIVEDELALPPNTRLHNPVIVEILQTEFKTYLVVHDYEYLDEKDHPMPADWMSYFKTTLPIVCVGWGGEMSIKDFERKKAKGEL